MQTNFVLLNIDILLHLSPVKDAVASSSETVPIVESETSQTPIKVNSKCPIHGKKKKVGHIY